MSSSRTANAALKPLMHQFNYGASSSVPFRHSVFPAARQFFEENEFKWRILCTIAGVAMGAITVENMINDLEQFEMFEMGCRFCLACFCIVLVMLEWHEYLPNYFSVVIQEEVHILYTAYGRSGFYTLTGLLTLCSKRTINWAIGLLGVGVGAYVFLSAKYVDNELHNLLDARHIEDQTKRIFAEFDKNGVSLLLLRQTTILTIPRSLCCTFSWATLDILILTLTLTAERESGEV